CRSASGPISTRRPSRFARRQPWTSFSPASPKCPVTCGTSRCSSSTSPRSDRSFDWRRSRRPAWAAAETWSTSSTRSSSTTWRFTGSGSPSVTARWRGFGRQSTSTGSSRRPSRARSCRGRLPGRNGPAAASCPPQALGCADLDYPTAILPTSWMTAAGRRTLGRAELEKLLRDECRAARPSSRGAGAQDLRESRQGRAVDLRGEHGVEGGYMTLHRHVLVDLRAGARALELGFVCGLVRSLLVRAGPHERCWAWPDCAVPLVLARRHDVHASDRAPLPWRARGRVVTSAWRPTSSARHTRKAPGPDVVKRARIRGPFAGTELRENPAAPWKEFGELLRGTLH